MKNFQYYKKPDNVYTHLLPIFKTLPKSTETKIWERKGMAKEGGGGSGGGGSE